MEKNKHKTEDAEMLAAMPIPQAFFRLALPAVAAQLINILYNLVDKMFIGHIPGVGKYALAGVGITCLLYTSQAAGKFAKKNLSNSFSRPCRRSSKIFRYSTAKRKRSIRS